MEFVLDLTGVAEPVDLFPARYEQRCRLAIKISPDSSRDRGLRIIAAYLQALHERPQVQALLAGRLVALGPNTAAERRSSESLGGSRGNLLWDEVRPMLSAAEHELRLISPYVVPHEDGADFLLSAARSGTEVTILTNSLEATDVAAVHAGYAKWRKRLFQGGVGAAAHRFIVWPPLPNSIPPQTFRLN